MAPSTRSSSSKSVIDHIVDICGFASDSTMVKIIVQQQWSELSDVTMLTLDDIKDLVLTKDDGSFDAKPMTIHVRRLKGFLLYYNRKSKDDFFTTLSDDDVLAITKTEFTEYCGSPDYHNDIAGGLIVKRPSSVPDSLTAQEFRKSIKRDKTHYSDLKDDKHFNTWNRGFIATAHMHHTHLILDSDYVPKTPEEIAVFAEMQTFMYAVFEEHLKTDTGKSLVSRYEGLRDAQSVYKELLKHAKSSTAAQLSGDTLLKYITSARYPGNWRGTSHGFVLHWKEQITQYEKLELETIPPRQKLRMLQNTVGDVSELSSVKQLSDQEVARGLPPLNFDSYIELLLSACSTYDKLHTEPRNAKRSVYATNVEFDTSMDNGEQYTIDTDVTEIIALMSNTQGSKYTAQNGQPTNRLPREVWDKLSQAQRDEFIAKRRAEREKMYGNNNNKPSGFARRSVNFHDHSETVNIDDIIDYTVNTHETHDRSDISGDQEKQSGDTLLAYMAGRTPNGSSPGDIRTVLASSQRPANKAVKTKVNSTETVPETIQFDGQTYRIHKGETITFNGHQYSASAHIVNYNVGKHKSIMGEKALVDRGANGCVIGTDMMVVEGSERFVDVSGLAGHQESQLRIVTGMALLHTHKGDAIGVFHQSALLGKGKSILSCVQMEHYGANIDDKSRQLGGRQRILMDGYQIPLDFHNGLPYLKCRKPTQAEVDDLPHIIMTADVDWDPTVYDNVIDDLNDFYDAQAEDHRNDNPFNDVGEYRHRTVATHTIHSELEFFDAYENQDLVDVIDDIIDSYHHDHVTDVYGVHTLETKPTKTDFDLIRPYFGWAPAETIRRTFDVTTQYARGRVSDTLKHHWRSRFPACNVKRRNEPVATDTVFSDTPAVDSGVKAAQLFVGRKSLVADVYPCKTDGEFVNTLEDNIRERGAMDKLISDGAKAEISTRVKDILRALIISSWHSEPYHENQNFAENRYATIKAATNRVLNMSGAPANTWLLALMYVCLLLNTTASAALGWVPPLQVLTGQTQDISAFLHFSFYEPVYYHPERDEFPSGSNEEQGWWVGIATHVGDVLTYKILTQKNRIIYRSAVRSASDPNVRNKRLAPFGRGPASNPTGDKIFVWSKTLPAMDQTEIPNVPSRMPTIDPESLLGRTFLKETEEDGQRFRTRIVRMIIDKEAELQKDPKYIKFLCEVDGDVADEILTYNEILDHIERDNKDVENDTEQVFNFRQITAHQGPLRTTDKDYKGSTYNVLVEWETGETTYEPLDMIGNDDPVTCAEYAARNGLLDTPGWKRFRRLGKNQEKVRRMVNQAKLKYYRREPFWKFGFLVPRTHEQAMEIDRKNGNTRWQDSEKLEMEQLQEYQTFIDKGKGAEAPSGYKKIRCHMVYDVKHDGRHKSRLVAGGHLTDPNKDSVYSGVVSLRGIRLITFLAELNNLLLWGADVGNAYLEAKTKEKVYIIAGPEFGELEGHTLIIYKALYGLRSSGLCWAQRFSDVLRSMGFQQSKAEDYIWMRERNEVYEYVAIYVDDILIAARNPSEIVKVLKEVHHFKLKGVGSLEYHLGCDYSRDADGTLSYGPKKYIEKMITQYATMFGSKPKEYVSPLDKGDHPELDTSEELGPDGIQKYQSMLGSLQWAVSLGRFDIHTATMTMSRFRVAPRKGHLERLQHIYGYLRKFSQAAIRVKTEEPDFSALPEQDFDWCYSVYGNVQEVLPKDLPKPLGKRVIITTYKDANLYHDMLTGRAVTGILHFFNQTLGDWYSKRQAVVETATFGSEFTAARIATDQIMDLRMTLRHLGVPVFQKTYMFGDNQAVVTNSTIPHSTLSKRHNALAYHRVREAIAAKILGYYWIDGKCNPADIVSKHWGYQQVYKLLQPILFSSCSTKNVLENHGETREENEEKKKQKQVCHGGNEGKVDGGDDINDKRTDSHNLSSPLSLTD